MQENLSDKYTLIENSGGNSLFSNLIVEDTVTKKQFFLQLIRPHFLDSNIPIESFYNSMLSVSKIQHSAIPVIHEINKDEGSFQIVNELKTGHSIIDKVHEGITLTKLLDYLSDLLSALDTLHNSNITHGDINPKNIIIDNKNSLYLLNTGLATFNSLLPKSKNLFSLIPNPAYLPPEAMPNSITTVESEIYSVGMTFYELLTGTLPFTGTNIETVKAKQAREGLVNARQLNSDIPETIESLLHRSLSWRPEDRFSSIKEFNELLTAAKKSLTSTENETLFPGIEIRTQLENQMKKFEATKGIEITTLKKVCPSCLNFNKNNADHCTICWLNISSESPLSLEGATKYRNKMSWKRRRRAWTKKGLYSLAILSLITLYFFDRSAPPGLLSEQPSSSISLSQGVGEWSTPRGGASGIGSIATTGPVPLGNIKWEKKIAVGFLASPTVSGNIIYATTLDKRILAINAINGEEIWETSTTGPLDSPAVISENQVFIPYRDRQIVSLNRYTGKQLWATELDDYSISWVIVDQGILYALSRDGTITSLDALTGQIRWTIYTEVQFLSPPSISQGILIAPGLKRRIFALEGKTGQTNLTYLSRNSIVSSAAISGKIAVLGGVDRHVRAINITENTLPFEKSILGTWSQFFLWSMAPFPPAQSGTIWTKYIGEEIKTSPAISGNRAIVTTSGGEILSMSLSNGEILWKSELPNKEIPNSPTIVNDTIFLSTNKSYVTGKSYIRAYDLKTGNLKWNTEITDAGTDSIAFANGTLYLTTKNGVIYAVD